MDDKPLAGSGKDKFQQKLLWYEPESSYATLSNAISAENSLGAWGDEKTLVLG